MSGLLDLFLCVAYVLRAKEKCAAWFFSYLRGIKFYVLIVCSSVFYLTCLKEQVHLPLLSNSTGIIHEIGGSSFIYLLSNDGWSSTFETLQIFL